MRRGENLKRKRSLFATLAALVLAGTVFKGSNVSYSAIGSGGGIAAITNRTVDFGASDAPLTPDQFAACKGCVQIPWALSATSIAYRGDGLPNHLRFDGKTIASIFLGTIK